MYSIQGLFIAQNGSLITGSIRFNFGARILFLTLECAERFIKHLYVDDNFKTYCFEGLEMDSDLFHNMQITPQPNN